jgi:hypothetical protein
VTRLVFGNFSGVVNIASGRQRTFKDAVEIVSRLVPAGLAINSRPRSKPKVDHGFHNGRLVGLFPDFKFHSLEDGIRKTLQAELTK